MPVRIVSLIIGLLATGLLSCLLAGMVRADAQAAAPVLPEAVMPALDQVHPNWSDFEPRFQPTVCPFTGRQDYNAERFRCGYVMVPEDRTRRASRLIRLSVLQVKGDIFAGADGTMAMVYLSGGPGGPSLGRGRLQRFNSGHNRALLAHMDMVWFDQRGVGYSEGNFCRAVPMPYQYGLPSADAETAFVADMDRCFGEARDAGVAVDGYTNWQNALDVRDIRRALGYDQWNVFGISYGTELAQAVAQVDPGGTRAIVLDSVVPAGYGTNDLNGMYAAGFRSALDAVDQMCAADSDCRRAYPNGASLSARFIATFEAYEADPLILEGLPPHSSDNGRIVLDGVVAAGSVFQALYDRNIYGDLPALLHALETRDVAALTTYVGTVGYTLDHRYGRGMSATINCRSGFRTGPDAPPPHGDGEPVLSPLMGTLAQASETLCPELFTTRPDPTATPAPSDIPTLVAMGAVDPITPPYYADEIMPRLTNGQRLDVAHTGHGALLSHWRPCGQAITRDFFLDPAAPVDTTCLEGVEPPQFLTDFRVTGAPMAFGLSLQSQAYPWAAIAAAGFLALLLVAFPLGALARRLDGTHSGNYGRARAVLALGAIASLVGTVLAVQTILVTASQNRATLPVGVPSSIAVGGWIALLGAVLGIVAVVLMVRSAGDPNRTIGTQIAITAGAIATVVMVWFLFSIGAGPVML